MFFLTTLAGSSELPRCVGYFTSLEEAEKVLSNNLGDLTEKGYYDTAVVEEISPGLYPRSKKISWWRYSRTTYEYLEGLVDPAERLPTEGWLPCEEPTEHQHVCNFAVG